MQDDLQKISIYIGSKSYTLNAPRENEEILRKAAKDVNILLAKLQSQYQAKNEDYLAVAVMEFAVKALSLEAQTGAERGTEEIAELDRKLDDYLNRL